MVGRRAGGGGRGGAVSVAKHSAAQGGKISRQSNAAAAADAASESLSALVVQEGRSHRRGTASAASAASPGGTVEEDVTLVYRRSRTRHTKQSFNAGESAQEASPANYNGTEVDTFAANSAAAVSTPEKEMLAFWQRACGDANRTRALSNCGVTDTVLPSEDSSAACSLSQEQLFCCSEDRMETARRALLNLHDLLYTPVDTSAAAGAPCAGYPCWVRPEQYAAVVALARVCEAAVPLQLPPLLRLSACPAIAYQQSDVCSGRKNATSGMKPLLWALPIATAAPAAPGVAAAEGISESTIDLVPSPVLLVDVQRRLGSLRRFHQLQVAYGKLIPVFRAASTVTELRQVFFLHDAAASHALGRVYQARRDGQCHAALAADEVPSCFLGNPLVLDTLLPFVGITARYPQEEALLQSYVVALKDMTAAEAGSWGPVASMASWRCTDGVYVVHHASRVHVVRQLLNEAQFYGLPPFLRSIRAMAGSHASTGFMSATRDGGWQRATVLQRAQSLYADQFFLTPDCLDPDLFSQPDPMQAQLVQEELVTLQRTHCAFGLVVGEADEVLTLVHRHMLYASGAWQQRVKEEKKESPPMLRPEMKAERLDGEGQADANAAATEGGAEDSGESGSGSGPGTPLPRPHASTDPLRYYVLRTVDAARRHQRHKAASAGPSAAPPLPFTHVQWIEHGSANRWSPNAHYYGLSYMVVLETEEEWAKEDGGTLMAKGMEPETTIAMNAAYCVNSMLELWHT
ncbi:hypothetical protein JIQ42_03837 [Leishmania sp. Namibia]|uniref:hypothetical protein n=1 Tax=Leishmania sp. Namibia TaxID=2802991 RepID=UPI001B415B4A|nr:hypothetical protein JIQ42_03837 [Leishmania sp. Namibia]